jgi:hypothetical protein
VVCVCRDDGSVARSDRDRDDDGRRTTTTTTSMRAMKATTSSRWVARDANGVDGWIRFAI